MKVFSFLFVILSYSSYLSIAKEADVTPQEWLDPWDMTNYDAATKTIDDGGTLSNLPRDGDSTPNHNPSAERLQAQLTQCHKNLEKLPAQCQGCAEKPVASASPCETPHFKRVIRIILGNLEDRGAHEVTVTASKDNIATLEKFIKSDKGNIQDAAEVVIAIISNFKGKDSVYDFNQWDLLSFSYVTKEAVLVLAALFFVVCAALVFEKHTTLTWQRQLWYVLFLCFAVSIPWEWYHLYRKAFASKQAQMEKNIPKECRPDHELQPLESLVIWFRNSFTFTNDICIKYQETLLVDPFWEISPSRAISATVASVIAQPFEHIAESLGKGFRALFREVPLQWQPFVFIAVIFLVVIVIFTISGLQIRLPFITVTTRNAPALPGNIHGNLQQLQNQLQNIERQLNNAPVQPRNAIDNAPLQEGIHNRLGQVHDILNAMNERQERWEETMQRAQPMIQQAPQPVQEGLGHAEAGAIVVGVQEERPERQTPIGKLPILETNPVTETSDLRVPVQNIDTAHAREFDLEES